MVGQDEHEQLVVKREEAHRKHKAEKRHATMTESVRRVEEKMAAKAASAEGEVSEGEESEAPATENEQEG